MWFRTSQVNPTVKIQPLKQKEKESIVPYLHKKKRMLKKSFLLDKFCVGDSFYQEISMITDSLPRSYLVKQCRDELNKMCKIEPLNAKFEGAKVTCVETVFKIHTTVTLTPSLIKSKSKSMVMVQE